MRKSKPRKSRNACTINLQRSVLFGGVSETASLLIIYKSRKCEFICSIVEAEIKPDGRSVYKVNHFGAPGVKFWWRNSHVCRDHFPQSRSMPNLVFCYQKLFWTTVRKNCSSDREKLLKFEAEGQEFAKFLISLEQFIQTVKGQNNFW